MGNSPLLSLILLLTFGVAASAQSLFEWSEAHDFPGGGHGADCNSEGVCVISFSTVIGGDAYILRSTDGGLTFDTTYQSEYDWRKEIKSPSPGPVQFLTDALVLVLLDSAYVLRSTDAGLTWDRLPISEYSSGFASHLIRLSDNEAAAVVKYNRSGSAFEPDSMFVTSDGGLTWSPTPTQPKLSQRSNTFSVQGLYTNGAGRFGTIIYYSSDSSSTVLLTETTDNGATWRERIVNAPTGFGAYGATITYFDQSHAVLTANASLDSGLVMHTSDGGETWTTTFFGQIRDDKGELTWTGMLTSSFLDSVRGIAATRDGIIETFDGGRTWRKRTGRVWIPFKLHYLDTSRALGLTSYGTLMVGSRETLTVNSSARTVDAKISQVVSCGDIIRFPGDHQYSPPSYRVTDVHGKHVESGAGTFVRAQLVPGLYFITFGNEDHGRQTIRLLVTSQ